MTSMANEEDDGAPPKKKRRKLDKVEKKERKPREKKEKKKKEVKPAKRRGLVPNPNIKLVDKDPLFEEKYDTYCNPASRWYFACKHSLCFCRVSHNV